MVYLQMSFLHFFYSKSCEVQTKWLFLVICCWWIIHHFVSVFSPLILWCLHNTSSAVYVIYPLVFTPRMVWCFHMDKSNSIIVAHSHLYPYLQPHLQYIKVFLFLKAGLNGQLHQSFGYCQCQWKQKQNTMQRPKRQRAFGMGQLFHNPNHQPTLTTN